MKCSPKQLAVVALFALFALGTGQCLAQTTVTMTAHGTVSSGWDDLGAIRAPGVVFVGQEFTLSLTLDTTRLTPTWVGGERSLGNTEGVAAIVGGNVTMGGHSYSWLIDDADAAATLSSNHNAASMSASGTNVFDGYGIRVQQYVTPDAGSPRFVYGTEFAQTIDFTDFTGASGVYLSIVMPSIPCGGPCPGGSGPAAPGTLLQADSLSQVVWTHASPVPEPASWAMLAAGAGLVGVARRRRSARASGLGVVQPA